MERMTVEDVVDAYEEHHLIPTEGGWGGQIMDRQGTTTACVALAMACRFGYAPVGSRINRPPQVCLVPIDATYIHRLLKTNLGDKVSLGQLAVGWDGHGRGDDETSDGPREFWRRFGWMAHAAVNEWMEAREKESEPDLFQSEEADECNLVLTF